MLSFLVRFLSLFSELVEMCGLLLAAVRESIRLSLGKSSESADGFLRSELFFVARRKLLGSFLDVSLFVGDCRSSFVMRLGVRNILVITGESFSVATVVVGSCEGVFGVPLIRL